MTSPTDPPECPVCLEPYNHTTTIPRVLPCGHSSCDTCLTHLHKLPSTSPPNTLRCPACTQLVPFLGPTSLPKNIDLLRFSPSPPPVPKPGPRRRFGFPGELFPDELYATWVPWVIPRGAVVVDHQQHEVCPGGDGIIIGRIAKSSNFSELRLNGIMGFRLVEDQEVGLVELGRFELNDSVLEYSYVSKVMSVLNCMSDGQRTELGSIVGVSLRNTKVCRVLGLWLDVESGLLYLVSVRMNDELLSLRDLSGKCEDWVDQLGVIGGELCEVLNSLRREGFVCGCMVLSCFCFDEFGHVYVDLGEVLVTGRKIRECVVKGIDGKQKREMDGSEDEDLVINVSKMDVLISPEVLLELLCKEGVDIQKNDMSFTVCYGSDVWLLSCVLLRLLIGKHFVEEMYHCLRDVFEAKREGVAEFKVMYLQWIENVKLGWETLMGSRLASLQEILLKCLDFDPGKRPLVTDVWKSIRGLNIHHYISNIGGLNGTCVKEDVGQCLILGEFCHASNNIRYESVSKSNKEHDDGVIDSSQPGEVGVDEAVKGFSAGKFQCKDLQGHLDCITGLSVGGGFLFSSSFDKTVNIWSLQDFTHVHTLRGHEHRVMAVVFVDQEKPLCISADSGGGICSWEVIQPFGDEPLNKWYEEKDWRYSGIHALAVSESGYLYTGSGDRLIKVWSLKDCTLLCTMEGHKSVVSTLALCNGVLYSGSWDGTVRLWCLHDHSPLAVFGGDMPSTASSVLALSAYQNMVIAAHEKGDLKIWMNDVLKESKHIHNGAVFALDMGERWLFSGGWDRTVKIQEISGAGTQIDVREVGSIASNSVVTALMCVQGMLFVGYANRLLKVYH